MLLHASCRPVVVCLSCVCTRLSVFFGDWKLQFFFFLLSVQLEHFPPNLWGKSPTCLLANSVSSLVCFVVVPCSLMMPVMMMIVMMKNALMMNIRKGGFTPRDTAGLYSTNYMTSETLTTPEGWTFVAMLQTNDNSSGNDSHLVWHHIIIYNIWFLSLFNRTLWSHPHVTLHLWYRMVKRVSCFLNLPYFNYFLSRRSYSELFVLTEDRHLTTLPSTSSLLPSPGDLGAEPATSGPSLSEQDSVSIPEGTHTHTWVSPAGQLISAKVLPLWRKILPSRQTLTAQFALSL